MKLPTCERTARTTLVADVHITLAPQAATEGARAYPVGAPTISPICSDPCAARRDGATRYLVRQPFVAEVPIALFSGVRVSRPVIRLKGLPSARRSRRAPDKEAR